MHSRSQILIVVAILLITQYSIPQISTNSSVTRIEDSALLDIHVLAYTEHSPIVITSDVDFIAQKELEGWLGNGTESSPYCIDGYNITYTGNCISISNVTVPFVIQNCFITKDFGANLTEDFDDCINFVNVSHGAIINNTCIDKGDAAIFINKSNCSVIGNIVHRNRIGVVLWNSSADVKSNKIEDSYSRSILMMGCSDCIISSNQLSADHDDTILVQDSQSCTFDRNNCSGRVTLQRCDEFAFSHNKITAWSSYAIFIEISSAMNVSYNNIRAAGSAFELVDSVNCIVEFNQIEGLGFMGEWRETELVIENSHDCTVANNALLGCFIISRSSRYCVITQNHLGGVGIKLEESTAIIVEDNKLTNTYSNGIEVTLSNQSTIAYNSISSTSYRSEYGVKSSNSEGCHYTGNEIVDYQNGIAIINGGSSTITYNYVYGQQNYGIILNSSSNNRLYGNRLTEQGQGPAADSGTNNQWDDGDFIGNFWEGIEEGILNIYGTAGSQDRFARPNSGTPSSFPQIHYQPLVRILATYTGQLIWIVWSGPFDYALYVNGSTAGLRYKDGSGRINVQFLAYPGSQYRFELEIYPIDMIIDPPLRSLPFNFNIAEADSDFDSMPDEWELLHGLDPMLDDAGWDADSDELFNLDEYLLGTDPQNPDSDFDSIFDGWEVMYGCNPLDASDASLDFDGDSLTNLQEFELGTDPTNSDSDYDDFPDDWEVRYGFDPNNPAVPLAEYFVFHTPLIISSSVIVIGLVGLQYLRLRKEIIRREKMAENEEEEKDRALEELRW